MVSTAVGVALAGRPTVALVGDLAFLHDASAMVAGEGEDMDLTVVVADNRGGGIFSFLPAAEVLDPGTFESLFGTPQGPDPAAVASGFGWPVDDLGPDAGPGGLESALARRVGAGSRSVIRVHLPGRTANVHHHRVVQDAVVDAVDSRPRLTPGTAGPVGPAPQQGRGSKEGMVDVAGAVAAAFLDAGGAVATGTAGAVVGVATGRVWGSPLASSGGVEMGPNGPPRNWVIIWEASSGWTTSTDELADGGTRRWAG